MSPYLLFPSIRERIFDVSSSSKPLNITLNIDMTNSVHNTYFHGISSLKPRINNAKAPIKEYITSNNEVLFSLNFFLSIRSLSIFFLAPLFAN